ncbi:MAG: hypothetical protein ACXAC2_22175, partial [Candidatus Kariarchaeaceae archaeon]
MFRLSRRVVADSISESERELFIKDFLSYWDHIRSFIDSDEKKYTQWQNWGKLAEKLYQEFTIPFYNSWKHTECLKFIESYIKNFNSLLLDVNGILTLIPHRIILYEAIERKSKLFEKLKEVPTHEQFKKSLLTLSKDL